MTEDLTTSLTVNKELWKRFRVKCIKDDKRLKEVLEQMIKKHLGDKL